MTDDPASPPPAASENIDEMLLAHWRGAYLLAYRILGDAHAAEDVVQDAYLAGIAAARHNPPRNPRVWMLGITANKAKEWLRAKETRRRLETQMNPVETAESPSQPDELRALRQNFEQLEEKYRVALSLHYEQGLTIGEVGSVLNIPQGSASTLISRGLERLRTALTREGHVVAPALFATQLPKLGAAISARPEFAATLKQAIVGATKPGAVAATASAASSAWLGGKLAAVAALLAVCIAAAVFLQRTPHTQTGPAVNSPLSGDKQNDTKGGEPMTEPIDKELAEILDRKFDGDYRRAYMKEILDDLENQMNLNSALPVNIRARSGLFTVNFKSVPVREVLEKLAAAEKLELDYRGNMVFLWKKAGAAELAPFEKTLQDGNATARSEAVCSLGGRGDKRSCELLLSALNNDKDPAVKMWAMFSLGNFRNVLTGVIPEAQLKTLTETLLKDVPPAGEYRSAWIRLLGATRQPAATKPLIDFLNGNDESARELASEALLNSPSTLAVDALVKLLGDANNEVRGNATYALRKTNVDRLVTELLAMAERKPLFPNEAESLALLPIERVLTEAKRMLASGNDTARANVPIMLAYVRGAGKKEAFKLLAPLVKDANRTMRYQAIWQLREVHNPDAVPVLTKVIDEEPDTQLKQLALESLAQTRTEASTQVVLERFKQMDGDLGYAFRALGDTRDPRAEEIIMKLWKDDTVKNRDMLIQALAGMRSERSLAEVATAAGSADDLTRWNATINLSRLRDPRAIDSLLPFLKHAPMAWMPAVAATAHAGT